MKTFLPAMVIEDDEQVRQFVAEVLQIDGWDVTESANALQAFQLAQQKPWKIIFCDVLLGDSNGYEVLKHFITEQPKTKIVLMTGYESAAGAMEATSIGAYDYLVKPFTAEKILSLSKRVREHFESADSPKRISKTETTYISDVNLVGRSPAFVESMKMVGRVAATNLPVLITGESGTGKEMVAKAIHKRSNRSLNSFVAVNCGAIPVELIESELFGHARGSFTGAERERMGLWEEANGGTIFLDEITETSQQFQIKILRALQQNEIRRVGSNRTIKTDVRVIAATNLNIEDEVKKGRFRQDLMYRLNAVSIKLPSLRERVEDIPILAEHFAQKASPGGQPVIFSAAALNILKNNYWQGNIRELENAVFHAVSLCDQVVYPEHLPSRLLESAEFASLEFHYDGKNDENLFSADNPQRWLSLAEIETQYVNEVLTHTQGNKQAAARLLHIDRKTLTRIINRTKSDR